MKHLIITCLLFLLCYNLAEAQTNANISGPENVLVVYNLNSGVSDSVMQYYINARNIPSTPNTLGLYLPDTTITVGGDTHTVVIAEGGNIIRDSVNHAIGTWYATQHAYKYFYEYMAAPIKEHLVNNDLIETIRYIVLCKGVPFKVQAGADSGSVICNVSVDGLLCMLGTDNYDILLDSIYTKYRRYAVSSTNYCRTCQLQITNPYYNADPNLNMNNRFEGGVFTRNWNGHTIKLDYLVSHLDGISYEMVTGMIDLSAQAINSDNYDWFIDADPSPCAGGNIMVSFANLAASRLNSIGFSNYFFDTTEDTVTYHSKPVMSYSSNGTHTSLSTYPNNCQDMAFPPDYIQSVLNFDYSPGAIFNTAESYNAELMSSISRRPGAEMGQVVEFFLMGGTLAVGHAYEPFTLGVIQNGIMFPSYQVGYSFIDAVWMGMQYLAWQNVVVGDPLTTIAWGKQQLAENLAWSGTNLVTGEIDITNHIITIEDSSVITLRHQGFITGDGKLMIGNNVTFNIYSWQKGLFLSYDSNNPRLVWGEHPSFGSSANYNIYRKIDTSAWSLIAQTTSLEYTDTEMLINIPGDLAPNLFYKILASSELPGYDTSNTVQASAEKGKNKITANNEIAELSYSLDQNYPNPFNPETRINYVIKENGLVQLAVYNVLGQLVKELVNEIQSAGSHSVNFNAVDLPSGVYFYQLNSGSYINSKKMLLVK